MDTSLTFGTEAAEGAGPRAAVVGVGAGAPAGLPALSVHLVAGTAAHICGDDREGGPVRSGFQGRSRALSTVSPRLTAEARAAPLVDRLAGCTALAGELGQCRTAAVGPARVGAGHQVRLAAPQKGVPGQPAAGSHQAQELGTGPGLGESGRKGQGVGLSP